MSATTESTQETKQILRIKDSGNGQILVNTTQQAIASVNRDGGFTSRVQCEPYDSKQILSNRIEKQRNAAHRLIRSANHFKGSDRTGTIPDIRDHVKEKYFNNKEVLKPDTQEPPFGRERARDVVHYTWNGNELILEEHFTTTINPTSYSPEQSRTYERTEFLQDPVMKTYIEAVLRLVPPEKRHVKGTIGINLLRTTGDVTTKVHHDDVEYLCTHVIDKHAGGGITQLHEKTPIPVPLVPLDKAPPLLTKTTLNPGEFMFHNDEEQSHAATRLEPKENGKPTYREVIICTIDRSDAPYVKSPNIEQPLSSLPWR